MNGRQAYIDGDYSAQVAAMDANLDALEANLLNFTLWNYCPDNHNKWGDNWNGEDLSIFCLGKDEQESSDKAERSTITSSDNTLSGETANNPSFTDEFLNRGGRATQAFVRPYPIACPGNPLLLRFNIRSKHMIFTFDHPFYGQTNDQPLKGETEMTTTVSKTPLSDLERWTEFFLPREHFPVKEQVEYIALSADSTGQYVIPENQGEWILDVDSQRLWFKCECCFGGSVTRTSKSSKNSKEIAPTIRHLIVVRRKSSLNSQSIQEFARQLSAKNRCCSCCC
jgi:hypothetical protein